MTTKKYLPDRLTQKKDSSKYTLVIFLEDPVMAKDPMTSLAVGLLSLVVHSIFLYQLA